MEDAKAVKIHNKLGQRLPGGARPGVTEEESRCERKNIYSTRVECCSALNSKLDSRNIERSYDYNPHVNYANAYNDWVNSTGYDYQQTTTKEYANRIQREPYFETRLILRYQLVEGSVILNASAGDRSRQVSRNRACFELFNQVRDMEMEGTDVATVLSTLESNQGAAEVTERFPWMRFRTDEYLRSIGYRPQDNLPQTQMDNEQSIKTTEQGEPTQESDKQINTIITRDQQETVIKPNNALDRMANMASSEPLHHFPSITSRWMPLPGFTISTGDKRLPFGDDKTEFKIFKIPEDLYTETTTPNLIPFSTFIYGRMDLEFRIVINANKFQCGKLLVSTKYDPYNAVYYHCTYQSALARNHVILDMCANNEAVITMPFRYHRPFLRLVKNDAASKGIRPGYYGALILHILSPLNVGTNGPSDIGCRVFFRFKEAEYTAMSYRVPVTQMPIGAEDFISSGTMLGMRELLRGAERAFDQVGSSRNQDKPSTLYATPVVPRPRLGFPSGRGLVDAVPLRVTPSALTNYADITIPGDEPTNFYELARIWGLYGAFDWSNTAKAGEELVAKIIDPTSRTYTGDGWSFRGEPTPLEYACANYAFWSGTIEMRLDFVSTAFHTGSVQMSVEFGRPTTSESELDSSATYVKIFHLGEQKSVDFVLPYIYDTVMRRSTNSFYDPYYLVDDKTLKKIKQHNMIVAPESKTVFKVRVTNPLRPIDGASAKIEVLVYWRAGENFVMHGLKGNSYKTFSETRMDDFPTQYYVPEEARKGYTTKELKAHFKAIWAQEARQEERDRKKAIEEEKQRQEQLKRPPQLQQQTINVDLTALQDAMAKSATELAALRTTMETNKDLVSKIEQRIASMETLMADGTNLLTKLPGTSSSSKPKARRTREAEFQMDNGSKEDQDPTDDFSPGVSARTAITTDGHMRFKDILRRPTLVIWKKPVEPRRTGGYFIPLVPPSVNMAVTLPDSGIWKLNADWCPTVMMTSTVSVMNLFRCWRGGMRYTFMFYALEDATAPIYISLVPHSGTRYLSNFEVFDDSTIDVPIAGANFTTEVVIPSVNPSVTIEAPYDTENSWSLIKEDDVELNYAWRDKADYNSGHLVITSHTKFTMDVWWSAADDFEVANFYGTILGYGTPVAYRYNDSHARVQMDDGGEYQSDFSSYNPLTLVKGFANRTRTLVWDKVSDTIHGIEAVQKVETTIDNVNKMTERVDHIADVVGTTAESILSMVTSAVESITTASTCVIGYSKMITDALFDLLVAWYDKSWLAASVGIIRFIFNAFGMAMTDALTTLGPKITELSALISDVFGAQASVPMTQGVWDLVKQEKTATTLISLIIGIVGSIMGVIIDMNPKYSKHFLGGVLKRLTTTQGITYFTAIITFIKAVFATIRDIIMDALGIVSVEARALQALGEKNELVRDFVREAQIVTSDVNTSLLATPKYRSRVWQLVLRAHQIQALVSSVTTPNVVSQQLTRTCTNVIKFANDHFVDLAAAPVRYEPLVIFLEGGAGVGKSFVVRTLVRRLLSSIGLKNMATESIYWRVSGRKFWDGYRDQPVVVFDEWMNTMNPEVCTQQCTELMLLKSCSQFIPEMAELTEKKIRANPLIVIVCTNDAFPNSLGSTVSTPAAILRRREILLRVERSPEYQGVNLREVADPEMRKRLAAFDHITFRRYSNVAKSDSLMSDKVPFERTVKYLTNYFQRYHKLETDNVHERMQDLPSFMSSGAANEAYMLGDPFSMFYRIGDRHITEDDLLTRGEEGKTYTYFEALETAAAMVAQGMVEAIPSDIPIKDEITWEEVAREPDDDPEVQVSFGDGEEEVTDKEILAIFMSSMVINMYYHGELEKIMYMSVKKLDELSDHLYAKLSAGIALNCMACEQTTQPVVMCEKSIGVPDGQKHLLCQACFMAKAHDKQGKRHMFKCMCCDSDRLVTFFREHQLNLMFTMAFLVKRGARTLEWMTDRLVQLRGVTSSATAMTSRAFWWMSMSLISFRLERDWLGRKILEYVPMPVYYSWLQVTQASLWWYIPKMIGSMIATASRKFLSKYRTEPVNNYRPEKRQYNVRMPDGTLIPFEEALQATPNGWEFRPDLKEKLNEQQQQRLNELRQREPGTSTEKKNDKHTDGQTQIDCDCEGACNCEILEEIHDEQRLNDGFDLDDIKIPMKFPSLVRNGESYFGECTDMYEPRVNAREFLRLMSTRVLTTACQHEFVIRNSHSLMVLIGNSEVWSCTDPKTGMIMKIPIARCDREDCYLDVDRHMALYRDMVGKFCGRHSAEYRRLYIAYHNREPFALDSIPPLFRRTSMVVEVEPVLSKPWYECLTGVWAKYGRAIIIFGAAVGVVVALYKLSSTVGVLFGATTAIQMSAAMASGERQPRNNNLRIGTRKGKRVISPYFTQADNACPTQFEVAINRIARNTVVITVHIGDQKKEMYGTGLRSRILLIPGHYVQPLMAYRDKGYKITARSLMGPMPLMGAEIEISDTTIHKSANADLAYLELPVKFPLFKDIYRFLALADDMDVLPAKGYLIANAKSGQGPFLTQLEVNIAGVMDRIRVQDKTAGIFEAFNPIVYDYSMNGVCGSILLRAGHTRPILGMHFAGHGQAFNGEGYAVQLTQEALSTLVALKQNEPIETEDVRYQSVDDMNIVFEDDIFLSYHGSVSKEKTPYTPDKTHLVESAIYGAPGLETVQQPAILSNRDPRYKWPETTPLREGVRKHGIITRDFPLEMLTRAKEAYWDIYMSALRPLVAAPKVLNIERAVAGLPGVNYYEPLDLTTSAGYPFNLDPHKKSKLEWMTPERDEVTQQVVGLEWVAPELINEIQRKRELRRSGIQPQTLFCDVLKDEKKSPKAFTKPGGTRIVCAAPVDYTIECRMRFLHFTASFMENRHKVCSALGCNPNGLEWAYIARKLLLKNEQWCTIDYTNFGPGYNANVAKAAYDLIIRWTMENVTEEDGSPMDERELNIIANECINSIHIANNTVYQQGAGSPSGAFFTTPVNTIVNILYLMVAWEALTKDYIRKSKEHANTLVFVLFAEKVSLYAYGDDGVFAVDPEFAQLYNTQTISQFFAQYGIVSTDGEKGDEIRPFIPWREASFLKRGFMVHPTRADCFLAPLREESIRSTTQWVWKTPNLRKTTELNACDALMEAYGHGPDWFNEFKHKVNQALRKVGCQPLTGTWEEYDSTFFGQDFSKILDNVLTSNVIKQQ